MLRTHTHGLPPASQTQPSSFARRDKLPLASLEGEEEKAPAARPGCKNSRSPLRKSQSKKKKIKIKKSEPNPQPGAGFTARGAPRSQDWGAVG